MKRQIQDTLAKTGYFIADILLWFKTGWDKHNEPSSLEMQVRQANNNLELLTKMLETTKMGIIDQNARLNIAC